MRLLGAVRSGRGRQRSLALEARAGCGSGGFHPLERKWGVATNLEAAPTGAGDAKRGRAFLQTALEKYQPALEVVPEGGKLERWVESGLAVGEGGAAGGDEAVATFQGSRPATPLMT